MDMTGEMAVPLAASPPAVLAFQIEDAVDHMRDGLDWC